MIMQISGQDVKQKQSLPGTTTTTPNVTSGKTGSSPQKSGAIKPSGRVTGLRLAGEAHGRNRVVPAEAPVVGGDNRPGLAVFLRKIA